MQYQPAPDSSEPTAHLVYESEGDEIRRFGFRERIELGRSSPDLPAPPGTLAIGDPTVSRHHCVVTCSTDGRRFIRDLSSNGTWLDGRRLVPNVEIEVRPGQRILLGDGHVFRLEAEACAGLPNESPRDGSGTLHLSGSGLVTVLVGDIRDYTTIVRRVSPETLQRSVNRVFQRLEKVVERHGGTVKEYQGDALFAFWDYRVPGPHAESACIAALSLHEEARRLGADPEVWELTSFPLRLDWAITTGVASTRSLGGEHPTGLSMVGEPVVLAFRLEKLADDTTGPCVVCSMTRAMAGHNLEFEDLGLLSAKGFEDSIHAFALRGTKDAPA